MNLQDVSKLLIPEGEVRTIQRNDGSQLWGKLSYDTRYEGDSFQQTYSGANLFENDTISFPSEATLNQDGSITVVYDNTNGSATHYTNLYTAPLDLQTSTTYAAFAEILSLSGGGTLAVIGGASAISQFTNNRTFNLANYSSGDIIKTTDTTKASFSNVTTGTRTYIGVQAGLRVNITFRMSVIADTSVTPSTFSYQPYTGGVPSPNPSYPQNIKVATGQQVVTIGDAVSSHPYPLDLGSIELCKIENAKDYIHYNNGAWHLRKNIEKINSYNGETISTNYVSTTGQLTTGATIYYVLASPTDVEITNSTLIEQLNSIQQFLTRYGYTSIVSGDLPIVIEKTNLP